jgi:RNA polymerase sigma-70 factor (ECF subfamily)
MGTAYQAPGSESAPTGAAVAGELELVAALRRGDEAAFVSLVERYQPTMLRVAALYVHTPAVAEDVVQETWLGVLRSLERFEGRSSLKTWIFRILANRAKSRGEREGRSIPFSALAGAEDADEPAVEPERFLPPEHGRWPGHWSSLPQSWEGLPEQQLLAGETAGLIKATIQTLPSSQQMVITLRDVEGWSADEVRAALGVSDGNQRVLLHRARAKVRRVLERYFAHEPTTA